ncbi:D-ribose pyranase [Lentilactobacillus kribbianus]|uniref:D-ribose pyranase n=1 Tax=Lentilactobacillus kribbianus TaxID=2729622 RepID=UPI0015572807|nr:D-ribose pyranase [Lentilactobacillus kribbianus]
MKKRGIINSNIAAVVANMGHNDWLSVGDAGMPVPNDISKIDLAVSAGTPSLEEVLINLLSEMEVQKVYLAEEIKKYNPDQLMVIKKILPDVSIDFVTHEELKKNLKKTKAFIRTGEMTPYANIILESGVTF